jgi:hypothetical protein
MNTLIAIAALCTLSACEVTDYQEPNTNDWNNFTVTDRTSDGKPIPTASIFDCRKITDAKNVHYYYNLVADPTGVESRNNDGEKVITYKSATFGIQYYSANYGRNGNHSFNKELISVDVDFQIIETSKGYSEAVVMANESTVKTMREYYKNNPYFNHIQVGDELLRLRSNSFQRTSTNMTQVDLPGVSEGDQLECR